MKKVIRIVLIVLASILLVVLGYVIYVFGSYHRLPDESVEVMNQKDEKIETEKDYKILTYNIGFGAYEPDYSFFMDGGKKSWAFSKERLDQNLNNIANYVDSLNDDIVLFQEVDSDSTRTYHFDERVYLSDKLPMGYFWAQNYDSPFLMYPFTEPHGISRSGIMTFSSFEMKDAKRISLPIETGVMKIVDLDRCYSKVILPTADGKDLILYNLHLSAYTSDGVISGEQLKILVSDMQKEYENGNYCIAGGDFNKDLSYDCETYFNTDADGQSWAQPIPEGLFDDTNVSLVFAYDPENPVPSCRNADAPYNENQFILTVDGFMVTDNVSVKHAEVKDIEFIYSDHNPVEMTFSLE